MAAAMPEAAKLPAFFYRLSPRAQRCYLRSDTIDRFDLTLTPALAARTRAALQTLAGGSLPAINAASQALVTELCQTLGVRPVMVEIRGVRPRDTRSELHGVFFPNARPPRLIVWMRTAQRREIVKPKTFLRTLAHEVGHYLDYALLKLEDSFHTRGFFQRESFLVRTLYQPTAADARQRGT
jgi:hypothetical protein